MANSGAVVKVYGDEGLFGTYSVPAGGGTAWTVVEIDGLTGELTTINTMDFVHSSEDVQSPSERTDEGQDDLRLLRTVPDKN
jgi:hypothetical protein